MMAPNLTPNAERFWREYWSGLFAMPRAWAQKSENLIHAFETLASAAEQERSSNFDVHDQALMLAGMACEVALKAMIVHSAGLRRTVTAPKKTLTKHEREQTEAFYSHDLVALIELADVKLSEADLLTAGILSEFILWRGRYVLPRGFHPDDYELVRNEDGHGTLRQNLQNHVTLDDARQLISRLVVEIGVRLYRPG